MKKKMITLLKKKQNNLIIIKFILVFSVENEQNLFDHFIARNLRLRFKTKIFDLNNTLLDLRATNDDGNQQSIVISIRELLFNAGFHFKHHFCSDSILPQLRDDLHSFFDAPVWCCYVHLCITCTCLFLFLFHSVHQHCEDSFHSH